MKRNLITAVMLLVMVIMTAAGMALAPVEEPCKNLANPKQIEYIMVSDKEGDMYFTYAKTHDGMLNESYGYREYVTEWTRIG